MGNFCRRVLKPQGSYTRIFAVCKIRTHNQLCNTSAHSLYGNKHNGLILRGFTSSRRWNRE